MRMTRAIRESIIKAVVAGVPTVDYVEREIAIRRKAERRSLPAKVLAIMDDPTTRFFLRNNFGLCSVRNHRGSRATYSCICNEGMQRLTPAEQRKIEQLTSDAEKQNARLKEARDAITIAVNSYTSTNKLVEAIPELAKYIPHQPEKIANLPARTDIVTTLKAAGVKLERGA